jgi:hypothetical protein
MADMIKRAVDIIKSVAANGDVLDVGMLVETFKEVRSEGAEAAAAICEDIADGYEDDGDDYGESKVARRCAKRIRYKLVTPQAIQGDEQRKAKT